mgnify:CR=1 FL=1
MASNPKQAKQRHHKRHMPPVAKVVKYWSEHPKPWMKGVVIGWNIPFCFACGWIPPMKIHEGFKWEGASRFLERAHLQDHCVCGNDKPSNLVFLCPLCHSAMPRFKSRKKALRWVCERYSHRMRTSSTALQALHDASWQLYTDTHPCRDRDDIRELYRLFLISIMLQAETTTN